MQTKHKRCECCGKYFLESSDKDEKYCCKECMEQFIRCTVCGNYYDLEKNVNIENFICSDDCAKKHKFKKQNANQKLDFSKLK